MNTIFNKYIIILAILLLNNSCAKLVSVDSPDNIIAEKDMFSSVLGYEAAFSGVYIQLQAYQSIGGGGLSSYMSLASDDLAPTPTSAIFQSFYKNSLLSSTSMLSTYWLNAYKTIYRCNLILENLESASFLSSDMKNEYKTRAVFIRSFCYYHLLQLFGDIPLALSSDYRLNATMERTPIKNVLKQIIADMEAVLSNSSKLFTSNRDHPNFYAVSVLLAKCYMLNDQFKEARQLCIDIYPEKNLRLETDLNKVFLKESKEIIFQLSTSVSVAPEGSLFLPYSTASKPVYICSNILLDAFEPGDKRKSSWIMKQEIGDVAYYYPYKYKNLATVPSTEFGVVFRLADVYLIDAECSIELKDYSRALTYLNKIRERAGIPLLTEAREELLNEELIRQRQLEFFAEWGIRWFDLKRWQIIDDVLGAVKSSWKSTAQWLPIPAGELKSNPYLIQNEGYDD